MPPYDVFLSYSSEDREMAESLARRFRDEGLEPFFDRWELVPGEEWQEALERALGASRCCAVLIGAAGIGAWENQEMRLAIRRRVDDRGFRVIPVLLPGVGEDARRALPDFLTSATWVELAHPDDRVGWRRLLAGVRGVRPGHSRAASRCGDLCPYRGLEAFDEEHREFFFGRDRTVDRMVRLLQESRFLAVVGPSGSGKSSVVRAGLLPALRNGFIDGSERWLTKVLKPGSRPLEALALALEGLAGRSVSTSEKAASVRAAIESLGADPEHLHLSALATRSERTEGGRVLLVVDQFEEIFALCEDDSARQAFVANLVRAATLDGGPVIVVLTLRADFYDECAQWPALADCLSASQILISPLQPEEVREAIARPALLVGASFEEGLVDQLVKDFYREPGPLPLLQHALLELWNRRRGNVLTHEAYADIGGLEGALARRAERVYEELGEEERDAARDLLLRLTHTRVNGEPTRRPAIFEDLVTGEASAEVVGRIVQRLVAGRLVIVTHDDERGTIVDIAHEALIRGWPRFRSWLAQEAEDLEAHRQLAEWAELWRREGRDPDLLARGRRLEGLAVWAAERLERMNRLERDFLLHSLARGDLDLGEWIPRFEEAETLAVAESFLDSPERGDRILAARVLRWLPRGDHSVADELLLRTVSAAGDRRSRAAAVAALCDRGRLAALIAAFRRAENREPLLRALGIARNLPGHGAEVDGLLRWREQAVVRLESATRLVRDHAAEFAIVFAISYLTVEVAARAVNAFLTPLRVPIASGIGGLTLLLTLSLTLYAHLRARIERRAVSVADAWRVGATAALILQAFRLPVLTTMAAFQLLPILLGFASNALTAALIAVGIRDLDRLRPLRRRPLRFAFLVTLTQNLWALTMLAWLYGRFGSWAEIGELLSRPLPEDAVEILDEMAPTFLSEEGAWAWIAVFVGARLLAGTMAVFAGYLGFSVGLRIAFGRGDAERLLGEAELAARRPGSEAPA